RKAGQEGQPWGGRKSQRPRQRAGYAHVGLVNPRKKTCRTIERERKQMTVEQSTDASFTPPPLTWKTIDWTTIRQEGRRLQMQIAKATQAGQQRRAQALQWVLTHSRSAKLLAVHRVTTNRGAKTPGALQGIAGPLDYGTTRPRGYRAPGTRIGNLTRGFLTADGG